MLEFLFKNLPLTLIPITRRGTRKEFKNLMQHVYKYELLYLATILVIYRLSNSQSFSHEKPCSL